MPVRTDDDLLARNYLKALQHAVDQRMSRRDFMKLTGAAGLGLLAVPGGFGCSSPVGDGFSPDASELSLILLAVDEVKSAGADYGDVRISRHWFESIRSREKQITGVSSSDSYGIGIRALVGGSWGFSATHKLTRDDVIRTAREAVNIASANNKIAPSEVTLAPVDVTKNVYWETPHEIDPFEVSIEDKADLLFRTNEAALSVPGVSFVSSGFSSVKEARLLATTDGSLIQQTLLRISPSVNITAVSSDRSDFQSRGAVAEAASLGWEYVQGLDLPGNAPAWGEDAVMKLSAAPVDAGKWDLVLHPSNLWLTIHENVGHPTELDRALGYEANYAGTSYLHPPEAVLNKLRMGPDFMNFQGDRTQVGGGATVGYDDEAVPADTWSIIEDGTFVDYQTTREQAAWIEEYTGITRSHGCSYGQTWASIPFQRMPNVSLMPGEDNLSEEDIIAQTDHGILIEGNGSYSIDQQRYNFQFAGQVFWEIKNGKKDRMLRDVAYVGRTPEFWNSLAAIGGKDTYYLGTTFGDAKGQPGQSNAVSHGCPVSLFRDVDIINTA
ncbi:MAG: TldD/PmbA family protein [Candidatus Latescibacteria bacterium]|jgi:TldD protein|nr:TldD/PmbA family protein [Candidatus Latescibacterota bacterium]